MENQLVIPFLTTLAQKYADTAKTLAKDFPSWNSKTDERILVFVKSANMLSSIKLGLVCSDKYLSEQKWWDQYPELKHSIDFHPNRASEFEVFMKASLAIFLFSIQEAALRCFVTAISPEKSDLARGNFGNVYPFLLRKAYRSDKKRDKYEALLKFWSLIRNSVHNNFVFSHTSGMNRKCNYRDKDYEFKIDQPVSFLTWKLFLLVAADLGDMLTDLVQTDILSSLPTVKTPVDLNLYHGSTE